MGFMDAYRALDADRTITYLADDANVASVIERVGPQGAEGPREEFELVFSLLRAESFQLMPDSCVEQGQSGTVTTFRCDYDFHGLGSDEIGRGPFPGSYFDLIVRDGKVAYVGPSYLEIGEFSPQMWEPFASWVSTNHPDDAAVMYTDESQTLERVTRESIRLWERNVRRYVEAVQRGDAT